MLALSLWLQRFGVARVAERLADRGDLEIEDACRAAPGLCDGLNPVELVAVVLGVIRQTAELGERVTEMDAVRVDDRHEHVVFGTFFMELIGALSNPEFIEALDSVNVALSGLDRRPSRHTVLPAEISQRQGDTLQAMKAILATCPGGLRTVELRARVQAALGRTCPSSTVKGMLAANPAFVRVSRGRYRLRRR